MLESGLTDKILQSVFKVHTALGPGLLESSYKQCLAYELMQTGIFFEKEKPMPLIYKDVQLECGYRIDLFVENRVVIEIKAVDTFNEVHLAQILTYMKLSKTRVGLLLNFNVSSMKNGIKRIAL